MGCGASQVVQAIEENPEKSPAPPDHQQSEELTSVRSNTPDLASRPVDARPSGPGIQSNGTEPSAPVLEDPLPQSPQERKAPQSGNNKQQQSKANKASTLTPHLGEDAPHPSLPCSPPGLCRGTLAHRTSIAPVAALLYSPRTLMSSRPGMTTYAPSARHYM